MSSGEISFTQADFAPVTAERPTQAIVRPSLSYWQDAWRRLRANRRALAALVIVGCLAILTIAGPWAWRVDPGAADVEQISLGAGLSQSGTIVEPHARWDGIPAAETGLAPGPVPTNLRLAEPATTQAVRLVWDRVPAAAGYRVYRNIYDPEPDRALGVPIRDLPSPDLVSVEDRLDLDPTRYWYSVVALDANGEETHDYTSLIVDAERVISAGEAATLGWIESVDDVELGDVIELPYHPLGTDYLGQRHPPQEVFQASIDGKRCVSKGEVHDARDHEREPRL